MKSLASKWLEVRRRFCPDILYFARGFCRQGGARGNLLPQVLK